MPIYSSNPASPCQIIQLLALFLKQNLQNILFPIIANMSETDLLTANVF